MRQVQLQSSGLNFCQDSICCFFSLFYELGGCSVVSGWVSSSVFDFHTVVVQPREEVTLWCSNFSILPVHIFWYKLVDGSNASCISSMFSSEVNASLREGFENGRFNMTSNRTNIFLSIKQVDASDSGLYICGKDLEWNIFSSTYLQVEVDVFVEPFWILCAASIFLLIIIICLVAKIRRIQKGIEYSLLMKMQKCTNTESLNLKPPSMNPESDNLNYAALTFKTPKTKRTRTAEAEKDLETTVVYAATR
uniref:Immunoglobulin domain-containing protein n=1 Tax=Poecilia reticulata TaxID=8081 RepID=A0A3P9N1L2_POERE